MNITISSELLTEILTIILALLSVYLGKKYQTAKKELQKMVNFTEKLAMALKITSQAIEDDKVTPEEEKKIVQRWKEVIDMGKEFLKSSWGEFLKSWR